MTGHTPACTIWQTTSVEEASCSCGYRDEVQRENKRKQASFELWRKDWSSQLTPAKFEGTHTPSSRGKMPLRTRVGVWWQDEMHVVDEDGKHLGELVIQTPAVGPVGPHLTLVVRIDPEPGARLG